MERVVQCNKNAPYAQERRSKVLASCIKYLRKGEYDTMVARLVAKEFGISISLAQLMIRVARRILVKQYYGEDSKGPLMNALNVLDGLILDPDCPHSVRLAAQVEKDRIFGLHSPTEIKKTGEMVHKVEVTFTEDWRRDYDILIEAPEEIARN